MYGVKKYKKKKSKKFFMFVLLFFVTIFVGISFLQSNMKSEDLENDKNSNLLEQTVDNIVSISSKNGNNNIWGSGVIVSKKGYILTNEHVVGDGLNCFIMLSTTEKLKADIVWSNSELDLAILKVNKNFINCAYIIDSENIKIAEDVYVVGNPINDGFEKSVSKGIISGLNRNIEFEEQGKVYYLTNLIQTDASVNFGNSGGALVNTQGQLIGICTIKITSAEGIAFAVPADVVKPIINILEKEEKYIEPRMGIRAYDKYSIDKLNVGKNLNTGVYVAEVNFESSAERSGIRVGDVIIKIDELEIKDINTLRKYIYEKNIGRNVKLKIFRDNRELEILMNLE